MIPRDLINSVIDTQHNVLNNIKAAIDMQAWYINKAVDEAEKYTKYFKPVEVKAK